ncbi:MAG TPA: hypothetical protein PKA95_17130 [Thermomicrobiales bacterium]|nr:hypothetical protein [Thermomicrobiales bacterium]
MRIVIEIDEHRTPAPLPEVSVMRAGPAGAIGPAGAGEQGPAAGETAAINAGSAAPLSEGETSETLPEGMPDAASSDASGAMSAGPAPEADATG